MISALTGRFTALLLMLTTFSCDTDKFLSYNYDADLIVRATNVTGQVTHAFTGLPVDRATVRFDDGRIVQTTLTNSRGVYNLDYLLSNDGQLNNEVEVTISAANYFSRSATIMLFPSENRFDSALEYAAPIILSSDRLSSRDANAVIFDYQGFEDIETVVLIGQYMRPDGSNFNHRVEMTFDTALDANRALYSCFWPACGLPDSIQVGESVAVVSTRSHAIEVVDRAGFTATETYLYMKTQPEAP